MNMLPNNQRRLTPKRPAGARIEAQYNQNRQREDPRQKASSNDPWGIVRKQQK